MKYMIKENKVLKRARQGDQQAISDLVMRYQHAVRNYLYALLPDPFIADDLAQEVFVKLMGSIDRIDPERGIKSYLMRIARNTAIDHWRKVGRRKESYHEVLFDDLEKTFYDQRCAQDDENAALLRRFEALKKCLKILNNRLYRVIMGFYYENLSCRDLAAAVGTNEGHIRTLLYRGRKALFACIVRRMGRAG